MALLRRIPSFFGVFLIAFVAFLILSALRSPSVRHWRQRVQLAAYRLSLRFWSVRHSVEGSLVKGPVLIVANHCSYLDIPVLGSVDNLRFTPKSDIRNWPVIGFIPPAFDVIYVERTPAKARRAQEDLFAALRAGDRVCVFPEGTTNDGRTLKPFKASLFSLAEQWDGEAPLPIQPVTVRYETADGEPLQGERWAEVAWFGDTDLVSHMWQFARFKDVRVRVFCHPPIHLEPGENRKGLCARAFAAVESGFYNA